MLTHLTINNYVLIEALDIDLQPGFSVMTGETGAGKSIILGALGLLMGVRLGGSGYGRRAGDRSRCGEEVFRKHIHLQQDRDEGHS